MRPTKGLKLGRNKVRHSIRSIYGEHSVIVVLLNQPFSTQHVPPLATHTRGQPATNSNSLYSILVAKLSAQAHTLKVIKLQIYNLTTTTTTIPPKLQQFSWKYLGGSEREPFHCTLGNLLFSATTKSAPSLRLSILLKVA